MMDPSHMLVEDMSDYLLEGDEDVVEYIANNMGPHAAMEYVHAFNNSCFQLMGFEHRLILIQDDPSMFIAPIFNLSSSELN